MMWALDWVSKHFLSARMFDGNIFYPSPHSVLFVEPLLGPAALAVPLRLFTANPILIYNACNILVMALASYGMYRLACTMTGDRGAALLAGVVVPYAPQQLRHLVHINLITIAGFPFMVLGLLRLFVKPGPWPALLAAFAYVFQAGTSGYHAISGALLALIFATWRWRDLRRPKVFLWTAAAALAAAALLSPYIFRFHDLTSGEGMTRGARMALPYSLDLGLDLLKTTSVFWAGTGLLREGALGVFPGVTVLVLAVVGVATRSRYRAFLIAIAVVFGTLSFGPWLKYRGEILMPLPLKWLMETLPFFDAIRHPKTFSVPAMFGIGLLACFGAARLSLGRRPWVLATVLLFAAVESFGGWPPRAPRPPLPAAYTFLQQQPPGAHLSLPMNDSENYTWWATLHGMPTVNGEGGWDARRYGDLYRLLRREWNDPATGSLAGRRSTTLLANRFPVDYVVLRRAAPPAMRRNIDATPALFTLLTETTDGDRVYRFTPAAARDAAAGAAPASR